MIACDTSVLVHFLAGDAVPEAERLDQELGNKNVAIPPVVLTEILSAPALGREIDQVIRRLPILVPTSGYWERAGRTRALLARLKLRAALADMLICQSCLDHDVPLLTRDRDFRHFARHTGLRLI